MGGRTIAGSNGDIAAFAITAPGARKPRGTRPVPHQREAERIALRETICERVRAITGMNCLIELIPPRTLPRTSSGKLSRSKARAQYLAGEIQPFAMAA